jgi:signal transduction histidine kinase
MGHRPLSVFVELTERLAAWKKYLRMLERPLAPGQRQRTIADNLTRRFAGSIGLAVAVGLAYFLAAWLSYNLSLTSEGLAVFWPASGVSSGLLIALGSRARWPVVSGVIVAVVADHLIMADPLRVGIAFALSDVAETIIIAGLIERYFGTGFSLNRLRHVLGMLAAAVIGTCVSGIGGVVASVLLRPPTVPILTIWQHWVASNTIGFIAVAPLLIGLTAALRQRPRSSELIEGAAALTALAVMTGAIISLSQERWETVVPIAWLSPMLLWLSARCRPIFAAAGAFIVSITIVCTTVFGIGHFGDPSLPIDDRILGAQASILVVALSAYVLAALFAERRENEARLASSNTMLERERSNKLMNLEAMAASISHEVKQPLTGITLNGSALLRYLGDTPPKLEKARSAAEKVIAAGHRIGQILDDLRNLFGTTERAPSPVNMNDLALGALRALDGELKNHSIATRTHLKPELPAVKGYSGQLQQVIVNLMQNAIDAMDSVDSDRRVLQVRTEDDGSQTVSISIEDTGPGLDPKKSDHLFDAFFTTKPHGMGLGLAICRMIVERHKGRLAVSPANPHGAIFQIKLPQMKLLH